jgi:hypothetical protein
MEKSFGKDFSTALLTRNYSRLRTQTVSAFWIAALFESVSVFCVVYGRVAHSLLWEGNTKLKGEET